MPRQTLGRGLSALLGEATQTAPSAETSLELDIDLIDPNPQQPRTRFAPAPTSPENGCTELSSRGATTRSGSRSSLCMRAIRSA